MNQKNILLVDDEEVELKNLRFLLDDEIEITYKKNYADAIVALEKNYNLYLVDLYLDEDFNKGFEKAIQLIKKIRVSNEDAKIIAISGLRETDTIVENCIKNGADIFLSKSNYDEWKEKINSFLYPSQILIIDDDDDIVGNFFGFAYKEYEFHYAENIEEGNKIIANTEIKLIILDLELDKTLSQGFKQGEANVKHLQKYNIPILVLSANNDINLAVKLLGMDIVSGYLNKNNYNKIEWNKNIKKAIKGDKFIAKEYNDIDMVYKNEQIQGIEKGLKTCVKWYNLHVDDFAEATGSVSKERANDGMSDYNFRIGVLELQLFDITSGMPETDKKELAENLKTIRNPESTEEVKQSAKSKAIKLLEKYGERIIKIGGQVALFYILQSLGLSLSDIGL